MQGRDRVMTLQRSFLFRCYVWQSPLLQATPLPLQSFKSIFYCLIIKMVNRCAVRAPVFDLELPEGAKDFERIRFRLQGRFTAPTRQSPHVERESDQSTRKGRHQHSSSLPI